MNYINGHCPVTTLLPSLYEHGDQARLNDVWPHIQRCPACQAEVQRLNALAAAQRTSQLAQLGRDIGIGLAFRLGFWSALFLRQFGETIGKALDKEADNRSRDR